MSSSSEHQDNNVDSDVSNGNSEKFVCIDDYERVAKYRMLKTVSDYINGGADEQITLRDNVIAYKSRKYQFKPRLLRDVSTVDISCSIFGDQLSMPIGVSPSALHKMIHPEGEVGTIRACQQANVVMVLSLFSTTSLEQVAHVAPACPKWQNVYILKNRELTLNVIRRAERHGYRAIVVTCDAPVLGQRRHDIHNGFTLGEFTLANIEDKQVVAMRDHADTIFDPSLTWQDIEWLKKQTRLKVIVKGIMCAEDARQAVQCGVDGVFVSNHGGRQLDGVPSTIEVLAECVAAVGGAVPVFVDGGIRTGADVLRALALGASMVFIGRPILWGLACNGHQGAYDVLNMLERELRRAMALCGCSSLADVNANLLTNK